MITFGRASILVVSALLTGCAGCPPAGQPTPTRIGPAPALFQDNSTCDCFYLFDIPDPARDVQRVDDQTSLVSAMVHATTLDRNPRAINTRYSFLVNKSESELEDMANQMTDRHELMFHGCRVPDANHEQGQEFVLNVEFSPNTALRRK